MVEITTGIVNNLLHELLVPLNTITGVYSVLKDVAPAGISGPINDVGQAGGQFLDEVKRLYQDPDKEIFDLNSPVKTAAQIRQLVSGWRAYEATLSDAVHQIRELRASGFKMEDPELDAIITETLFLGLEHLKRVMAYLETVEAEDLTSWNTERISQFLDPPDEEKT